MGFPRYQRKMQQAVVVGNKAKQTEIKNKWGAILNCEDN